MIWVLEKVGRSGVLQKVAESRGMPNLAILKLSVTNGIWGSISQTRRNNAVIIRAFCSTFAVSTISEQYATAGASGDKTPSQEHPMYNREQPESARVSQEETSSQEYSAENRSKCVITCLLSVKAQYLCVLSHISCHAQRTVML